MSVKDKVEEWISLDRDVEEKVHEWAWHPNKCDKKKVKKVE